MTQERSIIALPLSHCFLTGPCSFAHWKFPTPTFHTAILALGTRTWSQSVEVGVRVIFKILYTRVYVLTGALTALEAARL